MPPRNKQSERNSAKKAKNAAADEPEPAAPASGKLTEHVLQIVKSSVMFQVAPHMKTIVMDLKAELVDGKQPDAPAKKSEEAAKEDTNDANGDGQEKEGEEVNKTDPASLFEMLKERLFGANGLGLFPTSDATVKAFLALKTLEFDGGPRSKRKGTPTLDRLLANLNDNLLTYVYSLFAFMVLRSLLFRSWFACLPWLVFYQLASLLLPLEKTDKIPVPLEKVPLKARVAATVFLHGLVWLFFVYEFLFRAWWLEWILITGLLSTHAYVFRPVEA